MSFKLQCVSMWRKPWGRNKSLQAEFMTSSNDNGRHESPRTQRVREIVLTEGIRLLLSQGGGAVTALQITKATGVARSTIYRHWPDQACLLLDVVERCVRPGRPTVITHDLRGDLRIALTGLHKRMRIRRFRVVFATLLAQANSDDAFAAPQHRLVRGVLLPVREILLDAVARGRLPAELDVESAALQLAGPLLAQHVMLRLPISDELLESIIQQFLVVYPSPSVGVGEG